MQSARETISEPARAALEPAGPTRMLDLGAATEPFDFEALEARGGFAWWYLDLVDGQGNALVLIWFFGLPFLPAKEGTAVQDRARERPGICLAVYRNYRQVFYLLQEFAADAVECSADMSRICIAKNRFCLNADNGNVSFSGKIETEVPGSDVPLSGVVTANGPLRQGSAAGSSGGEHVWCPITAGATGSARLLLGRQPIADFQARAYLDRNSSTRPLSELGIEQWRWGRLAFPDREIVFYQLLPRERSQSPQTLVLSVSADGTTQELEQARLTWSDPARDIYGLAYHSTLRIVEPKGSELVVRARPPIDNGPFYLRFLLDARCAQTGYVASGVGELVRPGRIDLPRMRPFVQMRIHRVGGWNSPWLPLFSGPRGGRLARLLNHLGQRRKTEGTGAGGRK
jgi:carotenoid 1,2-hydratase